VAAGEDWSEEIGVVGVGTVTSPAVVVVELAAANTGGVNVKPLSSALVRILGSTLGCNNVVDVDDSTLCGAHTMMDDSKRLAASACSLMAITGTVCGGSKQQLGE